MPPPDAPQTFATITERNAYLETVAISYMMNVVMGRVSYDDHKYKCAVMILGYLEKQGYAPSTQEKEEVHPYQPASESPEVLFKQEVDQAPN